MVCVYDIPWYIKKKSDEKLEDECGLQVRVPVKGLLPWYQAAPVFIVSAKLVRGPLSHRR